MTDAKRIAVLEATCARHESTIAEMERRLALLGENAADRHDVHRRLLGIVSAIQALAAGQGRGGLRDLLPW